MLIQLPAKKGEANKLEIDVKQLVVIGANGSGKTRFGADIESRYLEKCHRVSAQRSLKFPAQVSPKTVEVAEVEFLYGYYYKDWDNDSLINSKLGNRWGGNINTFLLNDYEKLLTLLQTIEYESSLDYKEGRIDKPFTKLDIIQKIWEDLLPHRKLHKRAGQIQVYPNGNEEIKYSASEMSDGERVIFYLIGQVICAPKSSIIIIDEPEIHIHKSLIRRLFDSIEIERSDCSFIYLTHDIDFAFTRHEAKKLWAKSYEGDSVWDYEFIDESMPIPEQLYLEVLGSRRSVIFLEGDSSSVDYEIYSQVFHDFTLKPLGGCEQVINTVKAFNAQKHFHHIDSHGIIDRDRREDHEVQKLVSRQIWVLDVAEAENLYLIEDIVKAIAEYMGKNPENVFDQVKKNLFEFFRSQLDTQVLLHFKDTVKRDLASVINSDLQNINTIIEDIDFAYSNVDKVSKLEELKKKFNEVLTKEDYDALLRLFNLKNALIPQSKILDLVELKKEGYKNLLMTLLKKNDKVSERIRNGIKNKIVKT